MSYIPTKENINELCKQFVYRYNISSNDIKTLNTMINAIYDHLQIDDILLQEIVSLNEKIKILIKIQKYYNPELDESKFIAELGATDFQTFIDECYTNDAGREAQ